MSNLKNRVAKIEQERNPSGVTLVYLLYDDEPHRTAYLRQFPGDMQMRKPVFYIDTVDARA